MRVKRLTEAQKYTRALSKTAGKGDEMTRLMKPSLANGIGIVEELHMAEMTSLRKG